MTYFSEMLSKIKIVTFIFILISCTNTSNFRKRLIRTHYPEMLSENECKEGSEFKNGFLTKIKVNNKVYYLTNNHKVYCVGMLSAYSGSAGAEYSVYDENLKLLASRYFQESNGPNKLNIFKVVDESKKCKSGFMGVQIIEVNYKISFKNIGCMSRHL